MWKFVQFYKLILLIGLPILIISPRPAASEWQGLENTIAAGSNSFYRFCAVCHGFNAIGNGPYTENLARKPPNLTQLATNNNGEFPWLELYKIIDGTDIGPAHGTGEMPIWGNQFNLKNWSDKNTQFAEVIVRGRIFEILVYLQSIQE